MKKNSRRRKKGGTRWVANFINAIFIHSFVPAPAPLLTTNRVENCAQHQRNGNGVGGKCLDEVQATGGVVLHYVTVTKYLNMGYQQEAISVNGYVVRKALVNMYILFMHSTPHTNIPSHFPRHEKESD